jgi:hypothetical protein
MGLGKLIKEVSKGAGDIAKGAGKAVGGAAKTVGNTAEKAAKTVSHTAGDVAHGVGKAAGSVGKAVGSAGKGAAKVIGKAGSGAAAGAKTVVKEAAGAGEDIVKGAGKMAGGVAGGGEAFVDIVRHAATGDFKDIPHDLKRAGKSLFSGGKALVGIAESAGALYIWTNGAFVSVVVAGSAATNVLIKHRSLTAKEISFARRVFEDKIPYKRVVVTNLHSNDDRAFTIPNVDGDILLNLGPAYANPISYPSTDAEKKNTSNYPTPGQLFIHEMTHAWQIANTKFLPGLVCAGVINQTQHTILKKEGIYDPGKDFTKKWSSFNAEQQGTIVDSWFMDPSVSDAYGLKGAGMGERDPRFHYVRDNIRPGKA